MSSVVWPIRKREQSRLWLRILCKIGIHRWTICPILASLDTYWLIGGRECECGKRVLDIEQAAKLMVDCFERGKAQGRWKK